MKSIFCSILVLMVLIAINIWAKDKWSKRDSAWLNRTTSIRIYATAPQWNENSPIATASGRFSICLDGEQAQLAIANFHRDEDGFCNLCLSPSSENWYRLEFYRQGALLEYMDLQLDSGQTSPYDRGCLFALTTPSLRFYQDLIRNR